MTRPCRTVWPIAAALGLVSLLSGCGPCVYCSAERYDQGLVAVLPGIEGRSVFNDAIVDGLYKAGVPYAMEIHDWTSGLFVLFLPHLVSYDLNRYAARRIAGRLARYAYEYPGRPIWLVGQSGGGGVAVLVLEELPQGMQVEGAVLLAPALGPHYNLAFALRRCRRAIYNYYSPGDLLFLGLGTTVFGTIDRAHGSAAGCVGFRVPDNLAPDEKALYSSRLVQVNCSLGHFQGHLGLHLTSSNAGFVASTVAVPMLEGVELADRSRAAEGPSTRAPGSTETARAHPTGEPAGVSATRSPAPPRPERRAGVATRSPVVAPDARPKADKDASSVIRPTSVSAGSKTSGPAHQATVSHADWQTVGQVRVARQRRTGVGRSSPSNERPTVSAVPGQVQPRPGATSQQSSRPLRVDRGPERLGGPMGAPLPRRAPAPSAQWTPLDIRPTTQPAAIDSLEIPAPAAFRLVGKADRRSDLPSGFRSASPQ